jgi:class 3 adenylate cyclase
MNAGSPETSLADSADALLNHLRRNPVDALRPAPELATQFRMDPQFVASVLEGIQVKRSQVVKPKGPRFQGIRQLGTRLSRFIDGMMANPTQFVLWTSLIAVVTFALINQFGPTKVEVRGAGISFTDGGLFGLMLIAFATHMVCYFRHGMSRNALKGGAIVWGVTATAFAIGIARSHGTETTGQKLGYMVLASLGLVIISGLYAALGCLFSVAGGYVRSKVSERAEEQLSRQEILQRYFALQERLKEGARERVMEDRLLDSSLGEFFNRSPFLVASVYMAICTLLAMISQSITGLTRSSVPTNSGPVVQAFSLFIQLLVLALSSLGYVAFGLYSKSIGRAVLVSIAASAISVVVSWVPVGDFGFQNWWNRKEFGASLTVGAVFAFVSFTAAVGADLQRKASRQRKLHRNDPATVLAEMVRIQLRLAQHGGSICVLVVDAAKSAAMKANADPLTVEYSFREYQEWIEALCERFQGRVHSTAGDGAVVAFPNCPLAFDAARALQSDLARFNAEVNRLSHPFRLRIGMHMGQIVGNLDEVEFTEVIDIAAHVQSAAPIAGIAVTDDVAACMIEESFIPLADEIDGHRVLLAMNPTSD